MLNYGGLLTLISHELIHGYDTTGGLFDSQGETVDWWTPHARAQFEMRAQCFIQQYDQTVEPVTKLKVSAFELN